jgi:altronate hydrolase
MRKMSKINAYLRNDGKKGIRNVILICYLVECAKFVATKIANSFDDDVQVVGFPGCYPNDYSQDILQAITTHSNVGGVILVSLGCECFDKHTLYEYIKKSKREVKVLTIQENNGTLQSINCGKTWVKKTIKILEKTPKTQMDVSELVVGTICGGSDGTSGMSGNPAVGKAFDRLIKDDAICIFEETGELIGCEYIMANRAENDKVAKDLITSVNKASSYYKVMGHGSFASGNAEGGLSTQEEKSMGAYAKSGSSRISGVIKPGMYPEKKGLFLLDVVPDGRELWGFPNVNDTSEIIELIASGSHVILFVTGRGSVVGSAISPVIKICANPTTYHNLKEDMDINAGKIILGHSTLEEVGDEIYEKILTVSNGKLTKSEALGHREFVLGYKYFDNNTNCGIKL